MSKAVKKAPKVGPTHAALLKQIEALLKEANIESLKVKLGKANSLIERLNGRVSALQGELGLLKSENISLRQRLDQKQIEYDGLLHSPDKPWIAKNNHLCAEVTRLTGELINTKRELKRIRNAVSKGN